MNKSLRIRNAEPYEASRLSDLAIRSKSYWGYSAEFMAACQEELLVSIEKMENERFHYIVTERQDEVVGFYALEHLSDSEFELEALFVEPNHIGTGVGKALMSHAKSYAASLGGDTLIIQGDPNAERFYLAAGGRPTGNRESVSIPGRFLPTFSISLGDEDVA